MIEAPACAIERRRKGLLMFAQALAHRLSRVGAHCGWAVVAIVFLMAPIGREGGRERLVEASA
jgi:hypothetical protein